MPYLINPALRKKMVKSQKLKFINFFIKLKPSLLSRYIIKEQLPPMLVGVLFFTFVLVVNKIVLLLSLLIEKDVPLRFGIELFFLMLPFTIALTVPIAILMGTVMAMGRLSSDSEIVAMRASGISYLKIYKSLFFMGALYTIIMILFNNYLLPFANHRYRLLYDEIYHSEPVTLIDDGVFFSIPKTNQTIYVEKTDRKKNILENVIIYKENSRGGRDIIVAKTGEWVDKKISKNFKTLRLYHGRMHIGNRLTGGYTIVDFSENYMDINLRERGLRGGQVKRRQKSEREKSMSEIYQGIRKTKKDIFLSYIKTLKGRLNVAVAMGDLPPLYKRAEARDLAYRELEFWKHLTIPFACLALTLIGAPLGIVSHRSGKGMGLGFAVIISFAYYLILMTGERSARALKIPSWLGAWLPVISVSVLGIFLIYFRNSAENLIDELGSTWKRIVKFFGKKN